jgi:hypothetical protein
VGLRGCLRRLENLERRVGSPQPVVLVLMEDGPPGREREEAIEVDRFTLYATEDEESGGEHE